MNIEQLIQYRIEYIQACAVIAEVIGISMLIIALFTIILSVVVKVDDEIKIFTRAIGAIVLIIGAAVFIDGAISHNLAPKRARADMTNYNLVELKK